MAIWFNVLSNQVKVSFHIFLKLGRGVVLIYHSKAKKQPFCIKWGGVWSTSTYSCRARYSEMALITHQSPCADLMSVRNSSSARRDVSTIILVYFPYMYLCLAPGSQVNIPYYYDSPVTALSAELVQALYIYYCIFICNYNYPYLLACVLFSSQPERQQFDYLKFVQL